MGFLVERGCHVANGRHLITLRLDTVLINDMSRDGVVGEAVWPPQVPTGLAGMPWVPSCRGGLIEGVLDYGVLGEPAYVTWARLMGREDTRQKVFSRVQMGLSFAWMTSLASKCVVSFLCEPTLYNPSPLQCLYKPEGLVYRGHHNHTC